MRRAAVVVAAVLVVAAALVVAIVPGYVERDRNRLVGAPVAVPAAARALHERLPIVDLHADTLLWARDLVARGSRGHVDVQRLVEGNVALQAFTVVTQTPRAMNIDRNDDSTDNITLLALVQRWPARTWRSRRERALYQAERLHAAAARAGGRLRVVRTRADLDAVLAARTDPHGPRTRPVGAFLGLEGAQALENGVTDLDALFAAGFRMIAPVHFFDTAYGGSAHGVGKGGLTVAGRDLVRGLEERGMLLDLAHASGPTIDDALALARRPVVVSHTGVRGTCDNARNLTDAQVQGIARIGGVVGIGFWDTAVCGATPAHIARAIRHAATVGGIDHVALGSDWDGAVTTPFDAARLSELTAALLAAGFSEDEIAKVMGGNALRVVREVLPAR